jgi:hypothetical protein
VEVGSPLLLLAAIDVRAYPRDAVDLLEG